MKISGRRSVVHGHLSRLGSSDAVILLSKKKRALPRGLISNGSFEI